MRDETVRETMHETDKLILTIVLLLSMAITAFVWYMVRDLARLDYEIVHEQIVINERSTSTLIRPGREDSLHYERTKRARNRDK